MSDYQVIYHNRKDALIFRLTKIFIFHFSLLKIKKRVNERNEELKKEKEKLTACQ